jgi:hypothetical protein
VASLIKSFGQAELLIAMIEAFGAPRPTSNGLGELEWALVQAIENGGGGTTQLQLNDPTIDNAVQINEILQSGDPVLNAQQGVCYIQQPIVLPPGLGIWTPFKSGKNGGNFYVAGLRIMAAPSFSDSISTSYQNQYGLPPTLDSLVIMPGVSSWLDGVCVDGSTSPTNATPAHQFPVALYNTDLSLYSCEIRQATTPGAACMDLGELGQSQGTAFQTMLPALQAQPNGVVYTAGSPPTMTLNFASPLPSWLLANPPSAAANNWALFLSGVTGIGHGIPPNPINLPNNLTSTQIVINLNTATTGLTVAGPVASAQFLGSTRLNCYETVFESGTGFALDFGGVDTKIMGGRKQQGLAVFNCQGLDFTGMHLTGQGGIQTAFGNTGNWNTVVAARGQMVKAIFDTIPAGSTGLVGYMVNDAASDPFIFDSCEFHMNNANVTNVPVINRISTTYNSPLQIVGGSAYAAGGSYFASPNGSTYGGLIDIPISGDLGADLTTPSAAWNNVNTAGALFGGGGGGGTLPAAYSIMFTSSVGAGTWLSSPEGLASGQLGGPITVTGSLATFLTTSSLALGTWQIGISGIAIVAPASAVEIEANFGTAGGSFQGAKATEVQNLSATTNLVVPFSLSFFATVGTAGSIVFQSISAAGGSTIENVTFVNGYTQATGYTAVKVA